MSVINGINGNLSKGRQGSTYIGMLRTVLVIWSLHETATIQFLPC